MSQPLLMMAAAAVAAGSPAVTFLLENKTLASAEIGTARAGYRVRVNGEVQTLVGGLGSSYVTDADEWAVPRLPSLGNGYEVRFTKTSGTESLANDGVWQSLSVDRTVEVQEFGGGGGGARTLTFTVEIRRVGGSVIASATISLSAESLSP